MEHLFDILICVGPNDEEFVKLSTLYARANIVGYRNVYLICSNPSLQVSGCITISESIFPFSKDTVNTFHGSSSKSRHGWYFQQLLKLYAGFVVPGILPHYLSLDADVLFLKPTTFLKQNKMLYSTEPAHHQPYFDHMKRLHPSLKDSKKGSGIVDHMMFDIHYIQQLFLLVECYHNLPFYIVFLEQVDPGECLSSGASEFEIYFHYMMQYHPDAMVIRRLLKKNVKKIVKYITKPSKYDLVVYHYYNRSTN